MNREEVLKSRDKYLKEIKEKWQHKYPDMLSFYDNPANTNVGEMPILPPKKNSRKGLTPNKAIITDAELLHLLKRTSPGISRTVFEGFKGQNSEQIVEALLTNFDLPLPINNYSEDDPDVPFGESFADAGWSDVYTGDRIVSLKGWFAENLVQQGTSMHNYMWLFWHNHLVTELWGIFNGKFCYNYLKLLHNYSFGNFKELIYKMTLDANMLIYLNGIVNNKDAPDENFGRELQELFTVGKGPDAQYTEADVQAAARVMTGWSINWDTGEAVFYPWDHEEADKQFSEFYGNTVIEGKSGADGEGEVQELIDMIFENNEVAVFMVRKFYTFFVYATIDDWTEENIIQPLATIFRDSDYEVKPVLEALLNSEHFYDSVNFGAIIKTPLDVLVGWWRTMDIKPPFDPEENLLYQFRVNTSMYWTMESWGMSLGDPPNVAGWPAYYQIPTFDKTWVTTSTIVRRISYVDAFLYWGFWFENDDDLRVQFDILEFAKTLSNPGDPNALIAEIEDLFFGLTLEDSVRVAIKSILLSGQSEDYYWTDAWNAWFADPDDEAAETAVFNRLRYCFQRLFNLSEFQLK